MPVDRTPCPRRLCTRSPRASSKRISLQFAAYSGHSAPPHICIQVHNTQSSISPHSFVTMPHTHTQDNPELPDEKQKITADADMTVIPRTVRFAHGSLTLCRFPRSCPRLPVLHTCGHVLLLVMTPVQPSCLLPLVYISILALRLLYPYPSSSNIPP